MCNVPISNVDGTVKHHCGDSLRSAMKIMGERIHNKAHGTTFNI